MRNKLLTEIAQISVNKSQIKYKILKMNNITPDPFSNGNKFATTI